MIQGMNKKYIPSLQLMEIMYPYGDALDTLYALSKALSFGFYQAVETAVLCDRQSARNAHLICEDAGVRWTCWASPFINSEGLNISSLDSDAWKSSVDRLIQLMDIAAQSGAHAFAFLSGTCPDDSAMLPWALERVTEGMSTLAQKALQYRELDILIEPLDRDIHKHGTIGPSPDAVKLIQAVRKVNTRVYAVWDSAHIALQGENLSDSVRLFGDAIGQVHLCNAVLDPTSTLYGDYHIMPGAPGYLDDAAAATILRDIAQLDIRLPEIPVAIEARPFSEPWNAERTTREFLTHVLSMI